MPHGTSYIKYWTQGDVIEFALHWPCCNIPRMSGWAQFSANGDLVDIAMDFDGEFEGLAQFLENVRKNPDHINDTAIEEG